ncbi:hypothetical protein MMC07_005548 [Pseudocyphellaria aurata]|nr:hypothetical protein [Pseudocyphellaria aurata]
MALWLVLFLLANAIDAAPNIVFPINSQVPPVARVSKAFSFVFCESTFGSPRPHMDYSLTDAPRWLQLDGSTRTMYGTPGSEDAGSPSITLTATDDTGATSMAVTLIVSSEAGPGLGASVSDQLSASGGDFSAPSSLLLSHSSALHLQFSKTTFTNTNDDTVYYALCANNTPLPSWIAFDASTLSFSGTTPLSTSSTELSQKYDIHLTASDVVGFAGAIASFQIVVEGHMFSFGKSPKIINAIPGTAFSFPGLQSDLTLDRSPVNKSDLAQIVANTPPWMSFDDGTFLLSGTPPASAVSLNVTVTATDIYGDVANTIILVLLSESSTADFFQSSIGTLNATIGGDFDYKIDESLFAKPDLSVSADLGVAASWLSFDAANMKFHGSVPRDMQPQEDSVNLTVSQGTQSQSQVFKIAIGRGDETSQAIASPSASTGPATPSSSTDHRQPALATSGGASKKHWLPAAVIIPIAAVTGALLLAFLYVRKRKRRRRDETQNPSKEKISRPILQESSWVTVPENGVTNASAPSHRRELSRPPKIDLSGFWPAGPNNRRSQPRSSSATVDEGHQNPKHDSWRAFVGDFGSLEPVPSVAPESRRAPLADRSPVRKKSRQEKCRSGPFANPSLYRNLRAFGRAGSGMGHGLRLSDSRVSPGLGGPRGFGMVRESWRNTTTRKSHSSTEYATTTTDSSSHYPNSKHSENISLIVQDFPRTPTWNYTLDQKNARPFPTIRRVSRSQTPLSLQSVYKRPSSSPFFSAGRSSRATSHSYWKKPSRDTTPLAIALTQSRNQSTDRHSLPSSSQEDNSHLPKPQRSYSRSSSVRPYSPLPGPRHRHRGKSSLFSPAPPSRFPRPRRGRRSSRAVSASSSQRFGSVHIVDDPSASEEYASEPYFSDVEPSISSDRLVEGVGPDGSKLWLHPRRPMTAAAPPPQPHDRQDGGLLLGVDGGGGGDGDGDVGGKEEHEPPRSRLLTAAKRPISIDNTAPELAKGASMADGGGDRGGVGDGDGGKEDHEPPRSRLLTTLAKRPISIDRTTTTITTGEPSMAGKSENSEPYFSDNDHLVEGVGPDGSKLWLHPRRPMTAAEPPPPHDGSLLGVDPSASEGYCGGGCGNERGGCGGGVEQHEPPRSRLLTTLAKRPISIDNTAPELAKGASTGGRDPRLSIGRHDPRWSASRSLGPYSPAFELRTVEPISQYTVRDPSQFFFF